MGKGESKIMLRVRVRGMKGVGEEAKVEMG